MGAFLFISYFIKLILLPKSFIVLDPKGMVRSSIFGVIKAYPWKDIHVSAFSIRKTIKRYGIITDIFPDLKTEVKLPPYTEVYLEKPNGGHLKISPSNYVLKEFFDLDKFRKKLKSQQGSKLSKDEKFNLKMDRVELGNYTIALFALTFKYYFEMGKFGTSILIE